MYTLLHIDTHLQTHTHSCKESSLGGSLVPYIFKVLSPREMSELWVEEMEFKYPKVHSLSEKGKALRSIQALLGQDERRGQPTKP